MSTPTPRKKESGKPASPFSQLTYLLQLITSLNADGGHVSSFHKDEIASNSALDREGFTLLDSIAAILVQQHEVVAACYTSDMVSVVAAATDTTGISATDIDIDVDHDDPDDPVETPSPPGFHTFHTLQLAAVSNPDFSSSENLDTSNLHNVQIETRGINLWTKVQSNGWYCAFM